MKVYLTGGTPELREELTKAFGDMASVVPSPTQKLEPISTQEDLESYLDEIGQCSVLIHLLPSSDNLAALGVAINDKIPVILVGTEDLLKSFPFGRVASSILPVSCSIQKVPEIVQTVFLLRRLGLGSPGSQEAKDKLISLAFKLADLIAHNPKGG